MTSGRREEGRGEGGEQVLLPPPPMRLVSPRRSCPRPGGGSPTPRLPAAQQPAASPPLPGLLASLSSSQPRSASEQQKCLFSTGGMDPGFDR